MESNTHAGTLTPSHVYSIGATVSMLEVWGRWLHGTYMIASAVLYLPFQQNCGTMMNKIDAYKDLSIFEEWIKHYCQRKAGKLQLDSLSTAVPTVRGRFRKFYLVAHLRLACST